MGLLKRFWRKLTYTRALEQSSGRFEMLFFESVYRVAYITGLSINDHSLPYRLYSNVAKLLIALLVIGELWYVFTLAPTIDDIITCINTTLIQFISIYRYKNMLDHKDFYKSLAASMQSPFFNVSTSKRQQLVDMWINTNEKYLKVVIALGTCTLAAWYTYPLVDELEYNLIVGIRLPFRYDSTYMYPFSYVLVIIAFTYVAYFVMVTDVLMQAHLIHLLCQFTVLADCYENLVTDCCEEFKGIQRSNLMNHKNFTDMYLKRLGNLVEQHQLILSHTMNLRNSLSRPMLGQLAGSSTSICFVGYQAATTATESFAKFVMSLLFLGYNGFEIYIICRWCEKITIASQNISDAIYSSGWETGVSMLPGVRSTIKMVIARANKPLIFTAGGMYNLSLTSFSALVKTSYSALTVLLRFRH